MTLQVMPLKTALLTVYDNYYKHSDKPLLEKIKVRVWNAVKSIFGQSDWQKARNLLNIELYALSNKNTQNFNKCQFSGLREDTFSSSELNQMSDNLLTLLTSRKHSFSDNIDYIRKKHYMFCGEVLFKKIRSNPNFIKDFDLNSNEFKERSFKQQLEYIYDRSYGLNGGGFFGINPILYDVKN